MWTPTQAFNLAAKTEQKRWTNTGKAFNFCFILLYPKRISALREVASTDQFILYILSVVGSLFHQKIYENNVRS